MKIANEKSKPYILSDESKGTCSWTQSKTITRDFITAKTAFRTGAGNSLEFIDSETIRLRVPPDPAVGNYRDPKGYDYYFHVSLKNEGSESSNIILEALRSKTEVSNEEWFSSKAPIFCSTDKKRWYLLSNVKATKSHFNYQCPLKIDPGQTIWVSNNIPTDPICVRDCLLSICKLNSSIIQYHEIGSSVLREPLSLVHINSSPQVKKDRFLIWAGIHPSEPDTIAAFWIIDWLLSDDTDAKKILKKYSFDIVPMINPDGFNLGTSGCNSNGINIFWDFRKKDKEKSPESVALWKWVKKNPPQIALDIHAYMYQVHKPPRYYVGSVLLHSPEFRKVAWSTQVAVLNQLKGQSLFNDCKNSLTAYLKKKYNTLIFPGYHLRFADGPLACKNKIIKTIKTIISETSKYPSLNSLKDEKRSTFIFNNFWWYSLQILKEQLPRIIRKRFFSTSLNQCNIDLAREWKEHVYLSKTASAVATISSDKIF
tara:strand:+ start:12813 stop:14261 length:1449 start_codon:yes stop_codon:yes gene_type:complete